MKRMISGAAILMFGLLPIGTPAASASPQAPSRAPAQAAAPVRTDFAFTASGYATFVDGGTAVRSGKTALSVLACTNQAPLRDSSRIADANLAPALNVQVTGLVTTTQSLVVPGGYASLSENKTDVTIGDAMNGLNITGLRTKESAVQR